MAYKARKLNRLVSVERPTVPPGRIRTCAPRFRRPVLAIGSSWTNHLSGIAQRIRYPMIVTFLDAIVR